MKIDVIFFKQFSIKKKDYSLGKAMKIDFIVFKHFSI